MSSFPNGRWRFCAWLLLAHASRLFKAKIPSTRTEFWRRKLKANVERDLRAQVALAEAGWRVVVVWECLTRDSQALEAFPEMLSAWIKGPAILASFPCPIRVDDRCNDSCDFSC